MDKCNFNKLKEWFNHYIEDFNFNNNEDQQHIDLKYHHSYRVLNNINELIEDLKLTQDEQFTAKIIGLFHDLGRFEQYKQYKTFSDDKSIDHAELAVKILKEQNILKNNNIANTINKYIIYTSIQYHNKPKLPNYLTNKQLKFCKLIRDADKIDIWNIFVQRYLREKQNSKAILNLSQKPGITPEIFKNIINKKTVYYNNLKTLDDLKLMQMGWVYDLNFTKSLELVKKKRVIDIIYNTMSNSRYADQVYLQIKNYISKKTK